MTNKLIELQEYGVALAVAIEAEKSKPTRTRRTAVEAAKARLEAAQKREQLVLLKKARQHLEQANEMLKLVGNFQVCDDSGYGVVDYTVAVLIAVDAELAK